MAFLTKEQIIAAHDLKVETVSVPEWSADALVGVRVMRGSERDAFEELIADAKDGRVKNLRAHLCALTICDEQGGRLFGVDEVETLAEKSSEALDRIFEVARRINKLTPEEAEITKNASNPELKGDSGLD